MLALEFIGLVATAALSLSTPILSPAVDALENFNTKFAMRVDAGKSCFDRVSGTPGTYGNPHNYSLDPLCNYRLKYVTRDGEHKVLTLTRDRDGVKNEAAI